MKECLFCKIASKELPAEFVWEDEQVIAIKDVNPVAPTHILLIPKKHISSINEATNDDLELIGHMQIIAAQVAKKLEIAESGYRLVNNCGEQGGQTVNHIHYHLLGGRHMGWPPG
ncbi:MAG TPA: histidine triad nucleotide-binding protein [Syntrophomonadaceae bacterium]|nr:histidine triad nucleotide-binding protein [Syntrophomonadaceae bacterium]